MRNAQHTTRIIIGLSLFILFASTCTVHAVEATTPFKIVANIMEINLKKNEMVIAEEYVQLLSTQTGDTTIWQTAFRKTDGSSMRVSDFNIQDRVELKGTRNAAGKILADSITLIKASQSEEPTETNSPVQLKDGTWVN